MKKENLTPKNLKIILSVWDYDIKDDDTITILLNGVELLKHKLSNKKLVMPISLKADKNQLTIHEII